MDKEIKEYIVTVFSENQTGVLNRITALYLRRKINIENLRVSESSIKGISMFIISAFTTKEIIDKVVKQASRVVEVLDAKCHTADELVIQEVALYRISKAIFDKPENIDLIKGVRIIEMRADYIVVEMTGTREEINNFAITLKKEGVLEQFSCSGAVILFKESVEEMLKGLI